MAAATKTDTPQKKRAGRRTPVERVLPATILDQLRAAAVSPVAITMPLSADLNERLRIEEDYGISPRRLLNCLRRLQRAADDRPTTPEAASDERSDGWDRELRDHRVRQTSVAAILDSAFGPLAKCNPDLWGRRAYLMLVGLVYERLGGNDLDIPTDELVALAKVLAEHRRAERRESDGDNHSHGQRPPKHAKDGPLPGQIGDVVRQIYGTSFPPDKDTTDESAVGAQAESAPNTN